MINHTHNKSSTQCIFQRNIKKLVILFFNKNIQYMVEM